MNLRDLDAIVLVKPEAYQSLGKKSAEGYFKAEQRILNALQNGLILKGGEQLRAKTGFTSENLPDESPKRTDFSLDGIDFGLITNVKVINPPYQSAFDKITAYLEVMLNDWKAGIRRDNVRTYDVEITGERVELGNGEKKSQKAPFVEWNYLIRNVLWYLSEVREIGVENKIEKITAPPEIEEMNLESLVIPVSTMKDFDIEKPGAAKLWYLATRFAEDVSNRSVKPLKAALVERTGVSKERMPEETQKYWEQIEHYLFVVQSIPSPKREAGKTISRLFEIPHKTRREGALPIVPGPQNYHELLNEYQSTLSGSLKKWRKLDGNIGELVVFHYGIEHDERVQREFPFLPEYRLTRVGDKMFVSIQAVYDRMKMLEKDYVKNRLLRVHNQAPIV